MYSLTTWNGELIAGGWANFTEAGEQLVRRIARWDGSDWKPFVNAGSGNIGMNDTVWTLMERDGDLIVGGTFTHTGFPSPQVLLNHIGRWDGFEWHPFDSGGLTGVNGTVRAIVEYDGELVVGGGFTMAGGQTVNGIARWDGSSWHTLESGDQVGVGGDNAMVLALAVHDGQLVVGGNFTTAGGNVVNRLVRWDGSAWHSIIAAGGQIGLGNTVEAIVDWHGELVVAGQFENASGQPVNRIAKWVGADSMQPADLNCSGSVDVSDLLILLGAWGECPTSGPPVPPCPADLNGDGFVDVSDLLILLGNWG